MDSFNRVNAPEAWRLTHIPTAQFISSILRGLSALMHMHQFWTKQTRRASSSRVDTSF